MLNLVFWLSEIGVMLTVDRRILGSSSHARVTVLADAAAGPEFGAGGGSFRGCDEWDECLVGRGW